MHIFVLSCIFSIDPFSDGPAAGSTTDDHGSYSGYEDRTAPPRKVTGATGRASVQTTGRPINKEHFQFDKNGRIVGYANQNGS